MKDLISVFNDTLSYCEYGIQEDTKLSIESQTIYFENSEFDISGIKEKRNNKLIVTGRDTISAALNASGQTAVLNFASATNPGGGVAYGSRAQEECLCRCTNLYSCLNGSDYLRDNFYNYHKDLNDNRYTNRLIYTPDVLIFKDAQYEKLDPSDRKFVDVITCAAPNLRKNPVNNYNTGSPTQLILPDDELYHIHYNRGKQIILSAIINGCNSIVLGAFGCGVFNNNPVIVSMAYRALMDEYLKYFNQVEFAIFSSGDTKNYDAFKDAFRD